MHLTTYIGLVDEGERTLAESFRQVARGHRQEADVVHLSERFATQCDSHRQQLVPVMRRYGERKETEPERLHAEGLSSTRTGGVGLLRDGNEGAGRDPADVGSANFERDAEMSLAKNAREMLDQSRLALRHIDQGAYGRCDNCGQPIGKGRLMAFPRATLCVTCKQREERR